MALRHGADINAANFKGNTAMHFCSEYEHYELGSYLVEKGADPRIKNSKGFMASEGISHNKAALYRQILSEYEEEQ